ELVAKAGAPVDCLRHCVRDGFQVETTGIVAANLKREGVVEPKIGADLQVEARLIFAGDGVKDLLRIFGRRQFQNCGQSCASVLGVNVDASGENGLMTNVGTGEIEAALDGKVSFGLNLLGNDFSQHELLGEVFRAYNDTVAARRAAGGK